MPSATSTSSLRSVPKRASSSRQTSRPAAKSRGVRSGLCNAISRDDAVACAGVFRAATGSGVFRVHGYDP